LSTPSENAGVRLRPKSGVEINVKPAALKSEPHSVHNPIKFEEEETHASEKSVAIQAAIQEAKEQAKQMLQEKVANLELKALQHNPEDETNEKEILSKDVKKKLKKKKKKKSSTGDDQ
jgi:hypothetical protein